jgi:hypothetical protein
MVASQHAQSQSVLGMYVFREQMARKFMYAMYLQVIQAMHNTLSISVNAVPSHIGLHGGDRLGTCEMQPCGTAARPLTQLLPALQKRQQMEVIVAPNPSTTYFELAIKTKAKEAVKHKDNGCKW